MNRSNLFEVKSYTYAGPQSGFMKPEEMYVNYVMLGVEDGTFDFGVGIHAGRASFGDLIFTPPGTMFKRKSLGEITFHLIQFAVPADSQGNLAHLPVGKVSVTDSNRLSSTYAYLRKTWREFGAASKVSSLTCHMLTDLLYMCELEGQYALSRRKTTDPLMQQAAGFIHRQLFDEISMQSIAARLGIKPSELTRRFHLAYGIVPIEYATRLRLEEVKKMLRETNDTLETIASRCGYESGSYLSRVFRLKVGITPTDFRNNHQI